MAKATKTNTTTKTANKGAKVAKKDNKVVEKSNIMTYPQAMALTNAIFHSNKTKADLSAMIDKVNQSKKGGMKEDKKQAWLEKAGQEHCTYGQCKMFAFTLLKNKAPYDKISKLISDYDKENGYERPSKEGKAESK